MSKDESPSLVKLLGALFASALITAMVSGALIAQRVAPLGFASSSLWIASAAMALPALIVVATARLAAASLGGAASSRLRPILVAVSLTAATTCVLALAVGRLLRANTHHFGLAGTTFALVCAVLALGVLPLGMRVATTMQRWKPTQQSLLAAVSVLATALIVVMAIARVQRAIGQGELALAAAVPVDAAALLALGVLVSLSQLGRVRALSLLAPPLFVALVVVGISMGKSHPEVSSAVAESSLLAARCSAWLAR